MLASPAHLYMPQLFTYCLSTTVCAMLMSIVLFVFFILIVYLCYFLLLLFFCAFFHYEWMFIFSVSISLALA